MQDHLLGEGQFADWHKEIQLYDAIIAQYYLLALMAQEILEKQGNSTRSFTKFKEGPGKVFIGFYKD